jgi:prepilin-type N-terminal cleavage/methylation domain-containing protein
MRAQRKKSRRHAGFTLLEAMISIVILSVGVLSLAGVYAQGIFYASLSQYDYVAEKKAEQAVEAIFTARDIKQLTWASIQNVAQGGVFLNGAQPMLVPGSDGLVGTVTDESSTQEYITIGPGPDGVLGTSDDILVNLNPWMTRTIAITAVSGETNLRMITVTINYQVGTINRTYTLISYISAFA